MSRNFELLEANYTIDKIKFNVDDPFNNIIKEPFPNESFFLTIIGKPKSGKTNLLVNMLSKKDIYKKVFDKVLLCMPANSMKSMKNNIFENLAPDQIFNKVSPDIQHKIETIRKDYDEQEKEDKEKKRKKRMHNTLLIFDDVTAQLKNKENIKLLTELTTNRRHLHLSIIILSQYLRAIPRLIRSQNTHIIFFKPSNELDTKTLQEEYMNLKNDLFDDLMRFVFDAQYSFIFVDKEKELYYKKLQRIIFK